MFAALSLEVRDEFVLARSGRGDQGVQSLPRISEGRQISFGMLARSWDVKADRCSVPRYGKWRQRFQVV